MILCIGATPAWQRVMRFERVTRNAVNRARATLDGVAGKSVNVAKVLQALGESAVATGFLGGDRGRCLQSSLAELGLETDFVAVAAPTRECVTVIDDSAGTQTELVEESRAVAPDDYPRLLAVIERRVVGCRAAVMSGSLTPGGPVDFFLRTTRMGQAAGALCVIDAHGPPLAAALSAHPDVVKPNRLELAAMLGHELTDDADLRRAMRVLHERGARQVVVTAGDRPTVAYDGRSFWRVVPPRVTTVNPIGSGDAFTAGLVARLVRGDDLGEACRWGSAAGSANALTLMAGEVHRADVERLVGQVQVERIAD